MILAMTDLEVILQWCGVEGGWGKRDSGGEERKGKHDLWDICYVDLQREANHICVWELWL